MRGEKAIAMWPSPPRAISRAPESRPLSCGATIVSCALQTAVTGTGAGLRAERAEPVAGVAHLPRVAPEAEVGDPRAAVRRAECDEAGHPTCAKTSHIGPAGEPAHAVADDDDARRARLGDEFFDPRPHALGIGVDIAEDRLQRHRPDGVAGLLQLLAHPPPEAAIA
jgi:hypothetical protein